VLLSGVTSVETRCIFCSAQRLESVSHTVKCWII